MKIALYQMNIIWENKEKNFKKFAKILKETSEKGAELILLPEMSFTGFSMNTDVTKENDERTVCFVKEMAQKYRMAIAFGWVKDCGIKSENHYTVVDTHGMVIADYVKIHPFSFSGEDEKFQKGNKIVSFKLNDIAFSLFICYDLRFPEIFQIASLDSDVFLIGANWPQKRNEHWKCLLKARAIENQVYILAVNCVGEIDGIEYSGSSAVINPDGIVELYSENIETVLFYDLKDNIDKYRERFPIKCDRREKLYTVLRQGKYKE